MVECQKLIILCTTNNKTSKNIFVFWEFCSKFRKICFCKYCNRYIWTLKCATFEDTKKHKKGLVYYHLLIVTLKLHEVTVIYSSVTSSPLSCWHFPATFCNIKKNTINCLKVKIFGNKI